MTTEALNPPQGPSGHEIVETTRQRLLDADGRVRLEDITDAQRELLAVVVVPIAGDSTARVPCPNILDPTVRRIDQFPLHEISDDGGFLEAANNLHTAFCDRNVYNVIESRAHWRRFVALAPELNDWLQAHERRFQREKQTTVSALLTAAGVSGPWEMSEDDAAVFFAALPVRESVHMAALRLAYQITAQLVCVGDPYASPDNRMILAH